MLKFVLDSWHECKISDYLVPVEAMVAVPSSVDSCRAADRA